MINEQFKVGTQVARGDDWPYKDQDICYADGVLYHSRGTIIKNEPTKMRDYSFDVFDVEVVWESGKQFLYKYSNIKIVPSFVTNRDLRIVHAFEAIKQELSRFTDPFIYLPGVGSVSKVEIQTAWSRVLKSKVKAEEARKNANKLPCEGDLPCDLIGYDIES